MNSTRMTFGPKQELWIDFSSWLRFGVAGMYVIGTLKLEEECGSLRFLCSDSTTGPSKYFACLLDVAKDAFEFAFSVEEKKNTLLLDAYPILRSNANPFSSHNYHRMATIEDFKKELDESDEDESL